MKYDLVFANNRIKTLSVLVCCYVSTANMYWVVSTDILESCWEGVEGWQKKGEGKN